LNELAKLLLVDATYVHFPARRVAHGAGKERILLKQRRKELLRWRWRFRRAIGFVRDSKRHGRLRDT
jgi:hypothetical protein